MPNPFISKKEYSISYALVWVLIIGTHLAVLYFYSQQPLLESVIDAVVFNILFAGLGLSVWYAVRYYDSSQSAPLDVFLYHFGTAAIALSCWLGIGYFLISISMPGFEKYKEFLDNSMIWRGISGLLIYSVIVLIYYLYIHSEDLKLRVEKEAKLKLQVREGEIERLKNQINPHFLFNSLNSVSSLTMSKPDAAREMLVKLSDFLRYSLEFKENELTLLSSELDHIEHYLGIEKVRFGDRLLFSIQIHSDCKSCRVPNMILQPLIENAIKHGVYESIEPVEIRADIRFEDESLVISIKNTFDPEAAPRKGKGIGLQNVSNRMSLIYQADNLVHVKKGFDDFEVVLYIPQTSN
ncbi:MAG: histidine kinase [Bacteroidales bacterium]|nr:histidine kinase [Bacteroidales bacterium]